MSKGLFISCDEATAICTKNQYKEASFWEKIQLNVHIVRCKICGTYSRQNTKLTEVCHKHLVKPDCEHQLSNEEKVSLKKKIVDFDK